MEDFLLLEMPIFRPRYKRWKKYGYQKLTERNNLKETLEESTDGYCMYCYDSIWINGQRRGQIEHGIEKANSRQ